MPDEKQCWYCGRPAVVWCDFRLGATLGPPEQRQLAIGEPLPPPPPVVETCDAAACAGCQRRGWKQAARLILCVRGRKRRGCHIETIDRCHVHAQAGEGSSEWIGAAGVALARAEVRAACRRANDAETNTVRPD